MKKMTCFHCPKGCRLTVDDSDPNHIKIKGNSCPNGDISALFKGDDEGENDDLHRLPEGLPSDGR